MEDIGREDADDLREFELESLTLRDWIKSSRTSCFNLISNQFGRGSGGNRRNFSRQSVIDGITTRWYITHPRGNPKHQPTDDVSKHQATSKPAWLSALKIVTGTMEGSLFLVALLTAFLRCNSKPSLIIAWKKVGGL
ncbi:hypothetical protein LWI29_034518 [Acer saccharum]|uniref:Uncharacterized protein n=1 Tax=Acer saccharum TaxID=4024 RepID=A0AA39TJL8_ACESA|nr:hypothetical protein LWI29_034518 [Acer saccharum]